MILIVQVIDREDLVSFFEELHVDAFEDVDLKEEAGYLH
jgi:hypothetical protein